MRCSGRHLLLFLFLLSASLSALSPSFSDCFPPQKLERFWLDPAYVPANPNVQRFLTADFYSYAFDNSTAGLGLSDVSLAGGSQLLSSLPPGERKAFSVAASELDSASASLAQAKNASAAAHGLSLAAQKASAELFSTGQLLLYYSPLPIASLAILPTLLRSQDFVWYVVLYPQAYSATLSHSADAFEHASNAASEAARNADAEFSYLRAAGAGAASYSGAAKEPYLEASAFLSSCSNSGTAQAISDYFASSPRLPDFSPYGFGQYLSELGGSSENASVMRLARTRATLLAARQAMQGEFSSGLLLARQQEAALEDDLSSLSSQKLELISEAQPLRSGGLAVGPGFSGISSGLSAAREKLSLAHNLILSSSALFQSEGQDGFLALAISRAASAQEAASSARLSLESVRKNAQDAVAGQQEFARLSIARVQGLLSGNASSYQDAKAKAAVSLLLQKAQSAYAAAPHSGTLGGQFSGYSDSASLCAEALAILEGRLALPLSGSAAESLQSLSSLLSAAEADGLDAGYEQEKLRDYRQILSGTVSPDVSDAIAAAAETDRQALLLRLSEKYSGLSGDYGRTKLLVDEIRTTDPSFLPEFDSLSRLFPGGRADAESFAGSLSRVEKMLQDHYGKALSRLPAHLSSLLSANARVYEISSPPVLGKPTPYRATITVSNPSQAAWPGPLEVTVPTSLPIYPSDRLSGSLPQDVYYDNGRTVLVLSGIAPGEKLEFSFERKDYPAQATSASDSCAVASQQSATVERKISFFASRSLPVLLVEDSAPANATFAQATFLGRPLALAVSNGVASGSLPDVPEGKNQLEIAYRIPSPFSLSLQQLGASGAGGASGRLDHLASLSPSSTECNSATVSFQPPFSGVSNLSVTPLGAQKVYGASAVPYGSGATEVSFSFSPLSQGQSARFHVSFDVQNESAALEEAMQNAELSALYLNDSAQATALSQARSLLQSGRREEALLLLSASLGGQWGNGARDADYLAFLSANASASSLASQSTGALASLSGMNATQAAAALSRPLMELQSSISEAARLSAAGQHSKAASTLAKAESSFRSSLSSLAWKSASDAADAYAKARKASLSGTAAQQFLLEAEASLALAHSEYSQGRLLQSYLASSSAEQSILLAQQSSLLEASSALSAARELSEEYALLRESAGKLLGRYSSEYSSLSSQGKGRLPATPAAISSKLSEADKAMAAASAGKPDAHAALASANQSYQKLSSITALMEGALSGLESSARSSLSVAKLAVSEAKEKTGSQSELAQLDSEVQRAEEMLSNSLYAESISSSDRAIKAAGALLSANASAGPDAKAIAIGALSLAFLCAAALYFLRRGKAGKKKEKKEMPRAD